MEGRIGNVFKLTFINTITFKTLFGREADKLEHSNDDENTYYLMEKDPLVNRFISVPRDKSSLNCAVFVAGIIEAILTGTGFVRIKYLFLKIICNCNLYFVIAACKSDCSLA